MILKTVIMFAAVFPYLSYAIPGLNVIIDLSHYNTVVSIEDVKVSGVKGVIHKATQGMTCDDTNYEKVKALVVKEGMLWGATHFGTGESGVDQANHFLKVVGNDSNILLALDVEMNPSGDCGGQMTLTQAEEFVRTIYNARGRYPLVYGGKYYLFEMVKGKDTIVRKCPLWYSEYPLSQTPFFPQMEVGTWPTWDLWQYTNGFVGPEPRFVRGVITNNQLACDRDTINNVIYGNAEILWKKAGF